MFPTPQPASIRRARSSPSTRYIYSEIAPRILVTCADTLSEVKYTGFFSFILLSILLSSFLLSLLLAFLLAPPIGPRVGSPLFLLLAPHWPPCWLPCWPSCRLPHWPLAVRPAFFLVFSAPAPSHTLSVTRFQSSGRKSAITALLTSIPLSVRKIRPPSLCSMCSS